MFCAARDGISGIMRMHEAVALVQHHRKIVRGIDGENDLSVISFACPFENRLHQRFAYGTASGERRYPERNEFGYTGLVPECSA